MRHVIILPAFNEAPAIGEVIRDIHRHGFPRIIVVDDGSRDDTGAVAQERGAYVVNHRLNRGKGAAVKTGMEAAKLFGADVIITMDADGQHQAKDIYALIRPILSGHCDIALGTRQWQSREIPRRRVWQNRAANTATWLLYQQWVADSQSGFRAYSRLAAECIDTAADYYDFDSDVIREIKAHRLRFAEVPISVRYTPYASTKSTRQSLGSGLVTAARMLWQRVV
jgi:glycosyltransferase involved in cell wall biosynthesis